MPKRWQTLLICGLVMIAVGFFLWSRGYQNILGYAMLLLCPLMHLFMHGGHNHGGDHGDSHTNADSENGNEPKKPTCH